MIAPIQTSYKGYKMRSRTEAKWAIFFDTLGLRWQYEVEGFDLGAAGYYLPDFWLPDLRLWCEVKGIEPPAEELRKLQALAEGRGDNVLLLVGQPGAPKEIDAYMWRWSYEGRLFVGDFTEAEEIAGYARDGRSRIESLGTFLQGKVAEGLIAGPVPAFDGAQATLQALIDLDRQYYRARHGREHPHWEYGCTIADLRWCERQPGQWSLSYVCDTALAEHITPALLAAYGAARANWRQLNARIVPGGMAGS